MSEPRTNHANRAWPAERIARLIELADGTRSATDIAAEMRLGRNAVIGKFHRMKKDGLIDKTVRLLPGVGSHGRYRGKQKTATKAKVQTVRRLVPALSAPKAPTFLKAHSVAELVAQASDDGPLPTKPMPFGAAVDANCCLFFVGDPYAPASADMPVCGAKRLVPGRVLPPYCRRHLSLRYDKRRAA